MTNKLASTNVLVTGAGGFIGSRLVQELITAGGRVKAFVRYNSRHDFGLLRLLPEEFLSDVEIISGDLRDAHALEQAAQGAEVVFHLGALISIPYSYQHPGEVVESNIIGTLNVLQACRKSGCRLIHTSTSEVYGTALYAPIDEHHPLQGQSPYAASKIGADKLVESYYRTYDVHAITVRPFNTYGPGQSGRAVIPTIITQALTGDFIRLGNLAARRDFTFVSDTVDGFLRAAEVEGIDGEVFNLGSGLEVSIGDLAEIVIQLVGRPVKIESDPARFRPEKSEVMRLVSDNRKAQEILGWQPRVDIHSGLKQTISWIERHLELYRPGQYEL